jgi:hypothetical protein
MTELTLHHPRYTRSNSYDPMWVTANQMGPNQMGPNQMGPNVLWLTESLMEIMTIEPGLRCCPR